MQVRPTSALGLQVSLQRTWGATASGFPALVLAAVSSGNPLILTAAVGAVLLEGGLQLGWSSNQAGSQAFGESCLCSLAVNVSLCASPQRIALTEHWLFSSLHTSSSREKPSAGCGVSRRWSYEGGAVQPARV